MYGTSSQSRNGSAERSHADHSTVIPRWAMLLCTLLHFPLSVVESAMLRKGWPGAPSQKRARPQVGIK